MIKRLLSKSYLWVLLLPLAGCIENDIPLPYIKGDVLEFEISGQTGTSKIDPSTNHITLELSDTVNIAHSKISRLILSEGATSPLQAGAFLNLLTDTLFTVSTYQDFQWSIQVSQKIERYIELSGQIGDAVIDLENHNAAVYVSATQDLRAIVVERFQLGPSNAVVSPDPFLISDFSLPRTFTVSYHDKTETWEVVVIKTEEPVITGAANPWGLFAYLEADVKQETTLEAGFDFRTKGTTSWSYVQAMVSGSKASAKAVGLNPNTVYEYRGSLGSDKGEVKEFTTDIIPTIEDLGFDDWVLDGKIWYPNLSGANSYWATGNEGLSIIGNSNTTPVDGAQAVSGKAVRMETLNSVPIAQVAAGNMFTGTYETKIGTPQETAKSATMGRPYVGRPTALKGYYKYTPQTISSASYWKSAATAFNMNFADSVGKLDWGHIYIRLEKWPDGATVRPETESLIEVIGYGELRTNQTVENYTQFTIPVHYTDIVTKPTHISIVATSSINGGFFCGAAGSLLFVDEFELVFE